MMRHYIKLIFFDILHPYWALRRHMHNLLLGQRLDLLVPRSKFLLLSVFRMQTMLLSLVDVLLEFSSR